MSSLHESRWSGWNLESQQSLRPSASLTQSFSIIKKPWSWRHRPIWTETVIVYSGRVTDSEVMTSTAYNTRLCSWLSEWCLLWLNCCSYAVLMARGRFTQHRCSFPTLPRFSLWPLFTRAGAAVGVLAPGRPSRLGKQILTFPARLPQMFWGIGPGTDVSVLSGRSARSGNCGASRENQSVWPMISLSLKFFQFQLWLKLVINS